MSLKDDLNNLFICNTNQKRFRKPSYYLLGFILYSYTLSHYITCIYNSDKKCFVLFDDEFVKEYNSLYDLIYEITVNNLKGNGKAFFYPVMLIFTKECIYKPDVIKFNTLRESDYTNIIKKCNKEISEYQNEKNEEEKKLNYEDLLQKQKEIENEIKNKNKKKGKDPNIELTEKEKDNNKMNEKENNKNKKQINRIEKGKKDENDKNKAIDKNENSNNYFGKRNSIRRQYLNARRSKEENAL